MFILCVALTRDKINYLLLLPFSDENITFFVLEAALSLIYLINLYMGTLIE